MRKATLQALGLGDALIFGPGDANTHVTNLAVDSRHVVPGALFFALKGAQSHGADFAQIAMEKGAAAVVTSLEGAERLRGRLCEQGITAWPATIVVTHSPRRALAHAAAAFFQKQPNEFVAITGTNGKTSVARFTAQIWAKLGRPAAAFGTTGVWTCNLPGDAINEPLSHTTPEPITLHRLLARLANAGVVSAAMEASSHALAQQRVNGARFTAAAITNLTRDHLDYHRDAADYAAAKLRLFSEVLPNDATAIVNADSPIAQSVREIATARGQRMIEVGRSANSAGAIQIIDQHPDAGGQKILIRHLGVERALRIPLVGLFQSDNAVLAAALALAGGADVDAVFGALEQLEGAPGRMELVARRANGAGIFVDYAHTPDAVTAAVTALKPHTAGRIVVIVGAGGDRDPGKRAPMGTAAAQADFIIVTDDNPRNENPSNIRRQVWAGLRESAQRAQEIGDRAEAILTGVDSLEAGDVLLITGKGHETGQIIGQEILPFDDAEQARAAVTALDGLQT